MRTKRTIYEFDDFRVDTGQFFLTRAGHRAPLTPTVFKILLTLLERAGQVLTKEQLMKFVWPDSFVEEGNLNRNVSTLRKALDERPCDHRYIETIPKTGYRFVAPVRTREYQPPAGDVPKAAGVPMRHIVGRETDRAVLRQAYDRAQQGHGGIVCVSGDAGLGKSALAGVFLENLVQDGQTFHLAHGRCSEPLTESEPFMPWIEALSGLANESAVSDILQRTAPTWHKEISHTSAGAPAMMKRELLDFCRQISTVHPLVIFIDDFHWADLGSTDLLAFLATRLESTRTLLMICYRPAEMRIKRHPFLQIRSELLGREDFTEIPLAFLGPGDIEHHLALEHPDANFPPDYAAFLHARTEGNPLFMREMLRSGAGLSDCVRNLIRAKVDRLDDTHRQLLVTASVQGREFDSAVLAKSLQMATEDVEESLHELDEIYGLIRRIREEELSDGKFTVRYRFVYALHQEACYGSLAPTRRASLNASLAEAFLTYYGG